MSEPTSERTYEAIMVDLWDSHSGNMDRSCKVHTTSMLCHKDQSGFEDADGLGTYKFSPLWGKLLAL
jgi:hypothetical protein